MTPRSLRILPSAIRWKSTRGGGHYYFICLNPTPTHRALLAEGFAGVWFTPLDIKILRQSNSCICFPSPTVAVLFSSKWILRYALPEIWRDVVCLQKRLTFLLLYMILYQLNCSGMCFRNMHKVFCCFFCVQLKIAFSKLSLWVTDAVWKHGYTFGSCGWESTCAPCPWIVLRLKSVISGVGNSFPTVAFLFKFLRSFPLLRYH